MALTAHNPRHESSCQHHPVPEMRVTPYDRVSAFMLAAALASIIAVIAIASGLSVSRPQPPGRDTGVEYFPGGFEDGSPDETLNVESPEKENPNASPAETESEEQSTEEILDAVVELSDQAAEQVQQILGRDTVTGGTPGSQQGTGRPLGEDRGPGSGEPRESRWFVKFADQESLEEYARQLDYFGIELGVVHAKRSELVYVSNLSRATPTKRVVQSGRDEERLYMTWQGGRRQAADTKLLQKAGVDPAGGFIVHFYPAQTEQLLAQAERKYANRPESEIRRTYFVIVPSRNGYSFAVTMQTYLR